MIRRLLGQLAFLAFTVATTVVLIEVAARFLFPGWAPVEGGRQFWAYDEELGWHHAPGASGRYRFVDFDVAVRMNSHGLRDQEYAWERTPGRHRLLLLGDSFGWGYGVEQHEIFGEIIDAARDDWEVVNASVSGYGTDQEYLYYKLRGHRYQPDVVLLLVAMNDADNSSGPVQYWHNKPFFVVEEEGLRLTNFPVPGMTIRQRLANFVARHTYVVRIVWRALSDWRTERRAAKPALPAGGGADGTSPAEAARREGLPAKHERILRLALMLDEEVRASGARLVVVTLPGEHPAFSDSRFTSSGIPHLSLNGVFQGASERTTFEHDFHWTPTGHAMVAEAVERFLVAQGIFDARPEARNDARATAARRTPESASH